MEPDESLPSRCTKQSGLLCRSRIRDISLWINVTSINITHHHCVCDCNSLFITAYAKFCCITSLHNDHIIHCCNDKHSKERFSTGATWKPPANYWMRQELWSLDANQCTPLTWIHFLLQIWKALTGQYDHWKAVSDTAAKKVTSCRLSLHYSTVFFKAVFSFDYGGQMRNEQIIMHLSMFVETHL